MIQAEASNKDSFLFFGICLTKLRGSNWMVIKISATYNIHVIIDLQVKDIKNGYIPQAWER